MKGGIGKRGVEVGMTVCLSCCFKKGIRPCNIHVSYFEL